MTFQELLKIERAIQDNQTVAYYGNADDIIDVEEGYMYEIYSVHPFPTEEFSYPTAVILYTKPDDLRDYYITVALDDIDFKDIDIY